MALTIVGNINGRYQQQVVTNIYMANQEAAIAGAAYKLASRRWTIASAVSDRIYAICLKSVAAGANGVKVPGIMALVKDGDIIEADYVNVPNNAFEPGFEKAVLNSTMSSVDAAVVDNSSGHLIILEKDTGSAKVRCIATKHFTQA